MSGFEGKNIHSRKCGEPGGSKSQKLELSA